MKRLMVFLAVGALVAVSAACTSSSEEGSVSLPTGTPPPPAETALPPPSLASQPAPSPTASLTAFVTPTLTPAAVACLEGGRVEAGQMVTSRLEAPLAFRVYLPPCYDRQPNVFFPTLYLLHGQGFSDEQWERMGVVQVAETLIAQGDIPPLLIVMPAEQDHYASPEQNPYGEVLVDELLPYIEANYRARPGRAYRAIGGLSRGGNWALYLGVQRWDVFAAVGAHSAPFFRPYLPGDLRAWLRAIPAGRWPRFFLDAGVDDPGLEPILLVEQVLTEEDIPHEWHLNRGAHDEAYWSAHLRDYLLWYTEQW